MKWVSAKNTPMPWLHHCWGKARLELAGYYEHEDASGPVYDDIVLFHHPTHRSQWAAAIWDSEHGQWKSFMDDFDGRQALGPLDYVIGRYYCRSHLYQCIKDYYEIA